MKTEVNPKETARAEAFEMWMSSPMPMVTLTKTFDVSNLLKVGRKSGMKFNALLCWCIGKAVTQIKEFYLLPEQDKLYQYDAIAINVIVNNCKGGINSFTKALAKELAPSNIQVNAIACGVIDTDMNRCFSEEERQMIIDEIPADRMGTVNEAAEAVMMLLTSPSYLTGQVVTLDGGYL